MIKQEAINPPHFATEITHFATEISHFATEMTILRPNSSIRLQNTQFGCKMAHFGHKSFISFTYPHFVDISSIRTQNEIRTLNRKALEKGIRFYNEGNTTWLVLRPPIMSPLKKNRVKRKIKVCVNCQLEGGLKPPRINASL